MRKNNNPANINSIYKEIKKKKDFEGVTKKFLDDSIHTIIKDVKIISTLNPNADFYQVNSELIDLETPNLLHSSQSVQRISLTPTDSLSNSKDTPALDSNKTPLLEGATLTTTIYIANSSEDTPALNIKELQ